MAIPTPGRRAPRAVAWPALALGAALASACFLHAPAFLPSQPRRLPEVCAGRRGGHDIERRTVDAAAFPAPRPAVAFPVLVAPMGVMLEPAWAVSAAQAAADQEAGNKIILGAAVFLAVAFVITFLVISQTDTWKELVEGKKQ